jgi:hypothetical protein
MGEIVLHGQKFKIKGDTPTPSEQVAIDSYLDFREAKSGLTGNQAFDEQGILSLTPEEILSESKKGKYNKDTEGFLNSPSFKRIVAEVALSIVGGIAGAALAPVTGGTSLAASAGLAARVARMARPLLNISANTVSKIGAGTAGAAVGGGTGAALAQAFDPKEDIVREVTRGALQGGFGELAGFGLAGALSKTYNKLTKAKVNEVYGARRSLDILDREKKFFGELLKIKNVGQLTAKEIDELSKATGATALTKEQIGILKDPTKAQKIISEIEERQGTDFLVKDVPLGRITPGQAVESRAIDFTQGMVKSSFFGGPIIKAEGFATNTLGEGMNTFANSIIKASSKEGIDPNGYIIGNVIQNHLRKSQNLYNASKTSMWSELATNAETHLIDPITKKPIEKYLINLNNKIPRVWNSQLQTTEKGVSSIKSYAAETIADLEKSLATVRDPKLERFLGEILSLGDNISYMQLSKLYRDMQLFLNPADPRMSRIRAELTKRMVGMLEDAKLPSILNGQRNTVVAFSKMGDEVFDDVLMSKVMSSATGQEKVFKTIVLANNKSTTERFLNLIDKKIPITPGGPAVPLFKNAEEIKQGLRGQFFKNFLNAIEDQPGQYNILNSNKAGKFLKDYQSFIDDAGLITKEQATNLKDYVKALKFAQGKITKPGISDKGGSVFIQLKQAGAVTQLVPVVLGGTGTIDMGSAGAFFIAPAVLANLFTRPNAARVLIEGAKLNARNFGQYERYMTQLTSNLVGQGFVGPDQGKMVMDQVRASRPMLEQVFKGEIPVNTTLLKDRPADAPALDLSQQEAQQQLMAAQQSQRSTGQLPNVTPSNVGSISPQARMALAGGNLDQAIAAQSMQQMPQLKLGGIVSAKK